MCRYIYSFLLFLFIGGYLSGCQPSPDSTAEIDSNGTSAQLCAQRILTLDDSLGNVRNHAPEDRPLSTAIREYVHALEQLDFTGCSEDFETAFAEHRAAWVGVVPITDHYTELRGEMHELFDQIEKSPDSSLFRKRVDEIWATWSLVELSITK